jgi:myo-inositol-1(or 4)-monophosphatase
MSSETCRRRRQILQVAPMTEIQSDDLQPFFQQPELQELVRIVLDAGKMVCRYWPGSVSAGITMLDHQIQHKGDGTPVSTADYLSNSALTEGLQRLFPNDSILSEESIFDVEKLRQSTRTWVIDPLDGTSAFLEGRDDFSILVALSQGTRPTLGIQYFPARDELLLSEKGRGAYQNGVQLRVSNEVRCRQGAVYLRNFSPSDLGLASPWMDSGMAFARVARGELDGAVLRLSTHREWDLAAPISIIQEAGGRISDEGGNLVPCGTGSLSSRYFIASNGLVHDELLALVKTAIAQGQ